jgi:hypothetical protein
LVDKALRVIALYLATRTREEFCSEVELAEKNYEFLTAGRSSEEAKEESRQFADL